MTDSNEVGVVIIYVTWWGDHANALTAALWSDKQYNGELEAWFQMSN